MLVQSHHHRHERGQREADDSDQDQCRVEVVEVHAGPCLVHTGGTRAAAIDARVAACLAAHSPDSRSTPIVSPTATTSPRPAVRPLASMVTLEPCSVDAGRAACRESGGAYV